MKKVKKKFSGKKKTGCLPGAYSLQLTAWSTLSCLYVNVKECRVVFSGELQSKSKRFLRDTDDGQLDTTPLHCALYHTSIDCFVSHWALYHTELYITLCMPHIRWLLYIRLSFLSHRALYHISINCFLSHWALYHTDIYITLSFISHTRLLHCCDILYMHPW